MNKIDQFDCEWNMLSNFYYCPIVYKGKEYPTNEHAYQAYKSIDEDVRENIRGKRTAGEAKKAGRKATTRSDWDVVKLQVMEDLCRIKFTTSDYCKNKLISTGDAILIEGNSWGDTFWGICDNVGENHLGKILMKIRNEINQQV